MRTAENEDSNDRSSAVQRHIRGFKGHGQQEASVTSRLVEDQVRIFTD